jgi:hypothetical protein
MVATSGPELIACSALSQMEDLPAFWNGPVCLEGRVHSLVGEIADSDVRKQHLVLCTVNRRSGGLGGLRSGWCRQEHNLQVEE